MADDNGQDPPARSAADKEQARQKSRSVSAKGTTAAPSGATKGTSGTKGSTGKGTSGNKPRSATNGAPKSGGKTGSSPQAQRPKSGTRPPSDRARARTAPPRRSPTALLTWGVVALVLVIVVVLVIVKVTGGNSLASGPSGFTPAPASVVNDIENVPASTFNTVGVQSSVAPVTPPSQIKNLPPLTFPASTLPGAFYFGAEYCPYCAAERWPFTVAMSRFGKFTGLGEMQSSGTDVFPNTQTFTFHKAHYSSPYVAARMVEYQSNQIVNGNYGPLDPLTPQEHKLVTNYDQGKYFSSTGAASSTASGSYPFLDFGNKWFISGASYSPSVLTGLSREQIASNLNDPTNPVTQAIIATANYMSASVCASTNDQPASVCTSKGVTEAAKALGITKG
ncbi:MAG TPA: DUF929 family protein [Acidimicrobiales bacterium]|nr:DUF929 family protein [Acidimicrobiales bacterium]